MTADEETQYGKLQPKAYQSSSYESPSITLVSHNPATQHINPLTKTGVASVREQTYSQTIVDKEGKI